MKKYRNSTLFLILFISLTCSFNLNPSSLGNYILNNAGTSEYGDNYLRRVIVVNHSYDTYFDDFLYCAAIPAAIHWEGESKHELLLMQDRDTRMVNNLYSDWDCYLDKIGGCQHVDYIGTINNARKTEINGFFDNPSDIQQVSSSQNIYEAGKDIATYYWGSERDCVIDTAVLSYVPEANGGIEKYNVISGVSSGIDKWTIPVNSSDIGLLDAEISWSDITDSNYELSITDPYATHDKNYTTVGSYFEEHESQTNNVILENEGYEHLTMSPYYSGRAFIDVFNVTKMNENEGMLNTNGIVFNDSSDYQWPPEYPFDDMVEHKLTGIVAGQEINAILNWEEDPYLFMAIGLYKPGESPFEDGTGDDEIGFDWEFFPPLEFSVIAPVDGNYSLCVWLVGGPGPVNYELNATWTSPYNFTSDEANWTIEQPISGTDDYNYTITQYRSPAEEAIASVMNGAVAASLLDVPLLFTSGSTTETETITALDSLNIKNLIIIDPHDKIDENLWSDNYNTANYSNENSVFDYIYYLSSAKTGEKDVIVPAIGGAWFSTAALVGAYHAGPVVLPTNDLIKDTTSRSTIVWWNQVKSYMKGGIPTAQEHPPSWDTMIQISNDTFTWLESLNSSFNPMCNDVNADGVPDVGDSFDYSEDIDIIIVSPLNAIKPNFDNALIGKGSVGRFAFADPVLSGAWAARCMLYWYVGFSDTDNYANSKSSPLFNLR